jgi:hypothetical protein
MDGGGFTSFERLAKFDLASSTFSLLLMIISSSMEVGLKVQNAIQIFRAPHDINYNTLKIKIFEGSSIIICKFDRNHYHVIVTTLVTIEDLVLRFNFSFCHKLHKPLLSGCITTYMHLTYIQFSTPTTIASSSSKEKRDFYLSHEGWKKIDH